MADELDSIIPISVGARIAEMAVKEPDKIYDTLVRAEKWLEEVKEMARRQIINRIPPDVQKLVIENPNYNINAVRNKPKINVKRVLELMIEKKQDIGFVLFKTIKYDALPTARESLSTMLQAGVFTKDEYDSMFDKPIYTVSVKSKGVLNGEED